MTLANTNKVRWSLVFVLTSLLYLAMKIHKSKEKSQTAGILEYYHNILGKYALLSMRIIQTSTNTVIT